MVLVVLETALEAAVNLFVVSLTCLSVTDLGLAKVLEAVSLLADEDEVFVGAALEDAGALEVAVAVLADVVVGFDVSTVLVGAGFRVFGLGLGAAVVVALLAEATVDLVVEEVILLNPVEVALFMLDTSVFLIAPVVVFVAGLAVPLVSLVFGADLGLEVNGALVALAVVFDAAAGLLAIFGAPVSVFVKEVTLDVAEFVFGTALAAGLGLGFVVGLLGANEVLGVGVFLAAVVEVTLLFAAGFFSASLEAPTGVLSPVGAG